MKYFDEDAGFRGSVSWLTNDAGTTYFRWQMAASVYTLVRNSGSGDVDIGTFSGGGTFYAKGGLNTDGQMNAFGSSGYSTFGKDVYMAGVLGVNDGNFTEALAVKGKNATDRAKFYATQQMTVDIGATGTGGRTWGWRTGNNASGINGKVRLVDVTGAATVLEFDTSGNATFGGTAAPVFAAAPTTSLQGATKGYVDTAVAGVTGVPAVDIQVFTASGTWTKPVVGTPKFVYSRCVGPGGGGGSGRKGAAGTTRTGGSGGGAGGVSDGWWPASALPPTVTVTIGTQSTGGAAQATNSTNGLNASLPSATTFGDFLLANFGARGAGGANVAVNGGAAGTGMFSPGAAGGTAQTSGTSGAGAESTGYGPGGGGAGGPVSVANAATQGGNGGDGGGAFYPGTLTGGAGSTGAGSNGPDSATNSGIGGGGGGGGGGNHTGNAFAGGNGGFPGGGGGGGGGATDSVGNSGKGGDGGGGFCIVVTYF